MNELALGMIRPARRGSRRMRVLALGCVASLLLGCGGSNGLNGHDPVEAFRPLSAEEEQALEVMRAYIAASEALLQRPDIPAAQRAGLEHAIASTREALAAFIRMRKQGTARDESLTVIGGAALVITTDDASVVGVADNVLLIPVGLAAITTIIFTRSPATRDELLESWHQVAQSLDAMGDKVDEVIRTVDIAPLPDDPTERARRCTPVPVCPHKGGNPIHNACADGVPPNMYPGCDVLVNGMRFDAMDPTGRVLWEVKTDNWSNYTPWLQQTTVAKHARRARNEARTARECNFGFVFAVPDEGLYNELSKTIRDVNVRHVPECGVTKKP